MFTARDPGAFVGPAGGPFAMEIRVAAHDDTVEWAWQWAEAGAAPRETSRAVVRHTDH